MFFFYTVELLEVLNKKIILLGEMHMNRDINLREGSISSGLVRLAMPIMGTSFMQMVYSLTDMMWLGHLSTTAVAAAGAVGFFLWIGMSLVLVSQIGVSVGVSQAYGREDMMDAREYISNGIKLNLFIAVIYAIFLFVFRYQLIGFYNLDNMEAVNMAIAYLKIISFGIVFHFINPIFAAIFNASGNSVTPFKATAIGLVSNIILDPLLIFGIGPFPKLGIRGAGVATITAQIIVTVVFLIVTRKNLLFSKLNLLDMPKKDYIKRILKLGIPASLQSLAHATISMVLTRILANWGAVAVAVQSIGSQIESLSWMSAEGFSQAIAAFTGQNFGAKNFERVRNGYYKGLQIVGSIGIAVSILLIFGGKYIFKLFTPEDMEAIALGATYLSILGISQFFVTIEIGSAGAFNGIGKTHIPATTGIILNAIRIPMAMFLSSTFLGLNGVWWTISITSILKGIVITSLFIYTLKGGLANIKTSEV